MDPIQQSVQPPPPRSRRLVRGRSREAQRGGVMVIVAASMVAMIGFTALVVDIGRGLAMRTHHQAAADAGVLAAAMEYGNTDSEDLARQEAVDWVLRNAPQATIDGTNVTFWDHPSGQRAVTVDWTQPNTNFFGQMFQQTLAVRAQASATLASPAGLSGIIPLGLPAYDTGNEIRALTNLGDSTDMMDDSLYQAMTKDPTTEFMIKGSGDGQSGNYLALSLDGVGANIFRDDLANGSDATIQLYQEVQLQPGGMQGPTMQGARNRIGDTVIVPLIDRNDWNAARGRSATVTVIGFVSMVITDVVGGEIQARFTGTAVAAQGRLGEHTTPGVTAPILIPTP